jgi:hypothetical protein
MMHEDELCIFVAFLNECSKHSLLGNGCFLWYNGTWSVLWSLDPKISVCLGFMELLLDLF